MVGTFKLSFVTNLGHSAEISIPRANLEASQEEVVEAMNAIINSGVVLTSVGRPTQRSSARLVKTQTTDFTIN